MHPTFVEDCPAEGAQNNVDYNEVSVGRRNDTTNSSALYAEQIEELVKVINGDALANVWKTISYNWYGADSQLFMRALLAKLNYVTNEVKNENISKFDRGIHSNNNLFMIEQAKNINRLL